MLWGAVMPADRDIVAHLFTDILGSLPADIPFMRAGDQRQPLLPPFATIPGAHGGTIIPSHDTGFTISVGPPIDRVVDHPVDGGIARPASHDIAVVALCG